MAKRDSNLFGVIGLGQFGQSVTYALADAGYDVLVIDNDEDKLNKVQDRVEHAALVSRNDRETLEEAGVGNCSTVIVCIGENVEASILCTLNLVEMGVPRVIAKAISDDHGKILTKIGASVVFPERESALRLVRTLTSSSVVERIELGGNYAILEIRLPERYEGKQVVNTDIRSKYHLNIIALTRGGVTTADIRPDTRLYENDLVAVVGTVDDIRRFSK